MLTSFNPYSDTTFFGFFFVFFKRLFGFLTGALNFQEMATDEVQIFVLMGISLSASLVGTFLVLRKMTMLANALSHTILLGIVLAFLFSVTFSPNADPYLALPIMALILAAFFTGIVTTFLTEILTRIVRLQEDASIGLVFSFLFALSILLVTAFSRNVHIGTELIMGNLDALQKRDLSLVLLVMVGNLFLFFLSYRGLKITSFDPSLAKAYGFSPLFFNYLIMTQTSYTAIGAFKAVGVLLILAYLVIPILTARLLTHTLPKLIALSFLISCLASLCGVAISRHILTLFGVGLSTGGIVVILLSLFYLITAVLAPKRGLIPNYFLKKSLLKLKQPDL